MLLVILLLLKCLSSFCLVMFTADVFPTHLLAKEKSEYLRKLEACNLRKTWQVNWTGTIFPSVHLTETVAVSSGLYQCNTNIFEKWSVYFKK